MSSCARAPAPMWPTVMRSLGAPLTICPAASAAPVWRKPRRLRFMAGFIIRFGAAGVCSLESEMHAQHHLAKRTLPMTTVSFTVVCRGLAAAGWLFFTLAWSAAAQGINVTQALDGFDAYMAKTLKDWNGPGVGVGIVVNDKLVFAKGYGFRDYEKKLPFTIATMSPIASNTKLFTAVAAAMMVEEGKLSWDKPVRESVPSIR